MRAQHAQNQAHGLFFGPGPFLVSSLADDVPSPVRSETVELPCTLCPPGPHPSRPGPRSKAQPLSPSSSPTRPLLQPQDEGFRLGWIGSHLPPAEPVPFTQNSAPGMSILFPNPNPGLGPQGLNHCRSPLHPFSLNAPGPKAPSWPFPRVPSLVTLTPGCTSASLSPARQGGFARAVLGPDTLSPLFNLQPVAPSSVKPFRALHLSVCAHHWSF